MVIYDKVIPSQSMNSLFVLFSGVLLILVVDYGIRNVWHSPNSLDTSHSAV